MKKKAAPKKTAKKKQKPKLDMPKLRAKANEGLVTVVTSQEKRIKKLRERIEDMAIDQVEADATFAALTKENDEYRGLLNQLVKATSQVEMTAIVAKAMLALVDIIEGDAPTNVVQAEIL
jgi:Ulp1 family protease